MSDVHEVHERIDELQLVDVREPYEVEAGRIDGVIHIPLNALLAGGEAGRLDPDRPVVAICKVGSRSELAALMLQARGYDAQNMDGGMEAWEAAGYPFSGADGGPGKVL